MGFDVEPPPDDTEPAPGKLLCGSATRFSILDDELRELAAVATRSGFALFAANTTNELRGWTFAFDDAGVLAPRAKNLAIDSDVTGAFGASTAGESIVLGSIHGAMTTLGTRYHMFDEGLATRAGAVTSEGRVIGSVPLATSGLATEAVAGIRYEGTDIAVHGLAAGADQGTRMLGVGPEAPSELGIAPAGTSFAATWLDTAASPNAARVALLDETYGIVKGPVSVKNDLGEDVIEPRLHWSQALGAYAVAWFEKTPSGSDDVYVSILDDALAPTVFAKKVHVNAVRPKVASDETAFYVAYVARDANRIDIARVAPDGTMTIRSATSGGGAPMAFTVVERAGQPVLVYAEDTGDLWFEPLCP